MYFLMFALLQLVYFVCSFLPLVLTPPVSYFLSFQLLPSVCCHVVHFVTSVPTSHLFYIIPFVAFFPFLSPLTVSLLLWFFCCNLFFSFVIYTSFLSFQLSPFIRYFRPLVSTLCFHSDIPSVTAPLRFKSFVHFVTSFLSFYLSYTVRIRSLLLPFRLTS